MGHHRIDQHTHHKSPRGKRESILEEMMAENFPNLMKVMTINIQEAQQTPGKMNSETHTMAHYNQTFKRQRQRKNSESSKREMNTRDFQ